MIEKAYIEKREYVEIRASKVLIKQDDLDPPLNYDDIS